MESNENVVKRNHETQPVVIDEGAIEIGFNFCITSREFAPPMLTLE